MNFPILLCIITCENVLWIFGLFLRFSFIIIQPIRAILKVGGLHIRLKLIRIRICENKIKKKKYTYYLITSLLKSIIHYLKTQGIA